MAEMNPLGPSPPGHCRYAPSVPRPRQFIHGFRLQTTKEAEKDIQYPLDTTTTSITTITTASPTRHDEQQPCPIAHVTPPGHPPTSTRRYASSRPRSLRFKRTKTSDPIIDQLHAYYQQITEYCNNYDYDDLQARPDKSEDNYENYATLQEFNITRLQSINDPDD
eukprot:scaffold33394_cov62-Attheya_sp.AAC.1